MKTKRIVRIVAGSGVAFLGTSGVALGDGLTTADLAMGIDTVWVVIAAALVFFMQAGFGMVEAGLTRAKNAANILTKNFLDFAMAAIAFWAVGYALMWGQGNSLVGHSGWFLRGLPDTTSGIPTTAFWLFQVVFCGAAATIVAGGMAERMRFPAYLVYSAVVSAFLYPIVGHWVWGGGWLKEMGFADFAGSTVVHTVGGFAALAGTIVLRPRIGKFNRCAKAHDITGQFFRVDDIGQADD